MSVKLVLGTINRLNLFMSEEEKEDYYQKSLKPFISFVFKSPSIYVSCYYSGALLEWLSENHKEFIIMLQELAKENKIELIGSGFYEPIFPLLTNKEKRSQIDLFSTYIRQNFKQRVNGITLFNHVWEAPLASALIGSGVKYLLLPQEALSFSEFNSEEIYSRFITEDQGRTLSIFPIHTQLVSLLKGKGFDSFKKSFSQIPFSSKEAPIVNLIFDGATIIEDSYATKEHIALGCLKELTTYIEKCTSLIEYSKFSKLLKTPSMAKKVYISYYQNNCLDSKMFPLDKQCASLILKNRLKDSNQIYSHLQGNFRQFLTRYRESNLIYAKQQWVKLLISQCSDKERKKNASEVLLKSQRGDLLFYDENFPGIYDAKARKEVYANLIEAEKITREKGEFHPYICLHDYTLDGQDDILFSGNNFNIYFTKKGGEAFLLDYLPAKWNFVDTMNPYPELFSLIPDDADSHLSFEEQLSSCCYSPNLFVDFFIDKNADLNSPDIYSQIVPFNSNYDLESCNKEKKSFVLSTTKSINTSGESFDFHFTKQVTFKKDLSIHLEFKNNFDQIIHFKYGCALNLSFSQKDIKFSKVKEKNFEELKGDTNFVSQIDGFYAEDPNLNVTIEFGASKVFSLLKRPIVTSIMVNKAVNSIYQYQSFLPIWNLSIRPKSTIKLDFHLNIAKK